MELIVCTLVVGCYKRNFTKPLLLFLNPPNLGTAPRRHKDYKDGVAQFPVVDGQEIKTVFDVFEYVKPTVTLLSGYILLFDDTNIDNMH